jgi:hypothetical protein
MYLWKLKEARKAGMMTRRQAENGKHLSILMRVARIKFMKADASRDVNVTAMAL